MTASRASLRERIFRETGERIEMPAHTLPGARASLDHGLICGSPDRVAEAIAGLDRIGIGGVIASFRLGPLPHERAAASLTLFMQKVAPQFRA
jgi:alkanesulfonate monooxygenase SsuD/methylene tetrahydromethanopterin reductase-like flavin-dependent oxidoreductase (luciferase family)